MLSAFWIGTKYDGTEEFIHKDNKDDGIIWFLESFDFSDTTLITHLWQMKQMGYFKHVNGFVFGRPLMYNTWIEQPYNEAVMSILGDLDVPIIFDADIGHKGPQFSMINGAIAKSAVPMEKELYNMLELRDVKFSVNDENGSVKNIINGISMNIDESKFVAITGPNGSGKSTLAKLIVGINQPTEGRILYNGTDITNMSITERAKLGISFAFQQPVRFKGITVIDLLRIAAGKQLTISEACEYLSEVGLCARDYINREVDASLSGGELKRIEIATIIARGTELSVFDEPEAGIDLWSFNSLIKVFEKCRKIIKTQFNYFSQERILDIADEIVC